MWKWQMQRCPEIVGSRESRRAGRAWPRPAEGPGVQTEQFELGWLAGELRSPKGFWSMSEPRGTGALGCVGLRLHSTGGKHRQVCV